jgi:engulfment/cell motility protein 1
MSLNTIEDLTSCVLDFQANMIRVTYHKKITSVDPDTEEAHAAALAAIWKHSGLEEEIDANGQVIKWRRLGFETEDIIQAFKDVGVLGLECLVSARVTLIKSVVIIFFPLETLCRK